MATLRSASRSETGPVRENNEDIVVSSPLLLVVADGMGGTPGGEVAANTAVALVQAAFTGRSSDELEAAVRAANWAIWDQAAARSDLSGMGTTICAVGLVEDARRLAVIHVGDSRAYLWHNRQLLQLTRDHTVTADLVSRGELREEEASQHPHFGILTRALGVAPEVEVDSASRPVVTGDRLLLCSDGLVKEVSDGEIADAMGATQDVVELADTLVGVAIARGGRDNISLLVGEVAA